MDKLSTGEKVAISVGVIVPVILAVVLGCVYGIPASAQTMPPAPAPSPTYTLAPIAALSPTYTLAPIAALSPTYTLAPIAAPASIYSLAPIAGPGFPLNLMGGATYLDASKTSFETNGTKGYAITAQPFSNICTVSGYTPIYNASYIGLTDPNTVIADPNNPVNSFTYLIYTSGDQLLTVNNGSNSSARIMYSNFPSINPNTDSANLSVSYNGVDICFYYNGLEVPQLRISNVGTGRTFYGVWASYTNKSFSNLVWAPTALPEAAPGGASAFAS